MRKTNLGKRGVLGQVFCCGEEVGVERRIGHVKQAHLNAKMRRG